MSGLQPVRGTHDLLPDDMRRFAHVADTACRGAPAYGYREMATPIFEFTECSSARLGETSDVVTKEMYTFTDKGGDESHHPAAGRHGGCRRALHLNGGLAQHLPLKSSMSARCSAMSGRRRAVSASSTRSASNCWASRARRRCRGDRDRPSTFLRPADDPRSLRARDQFAGRPGEPGGLSQGADRLFLRSRGPAVGGLAWIGWHAIRCASSTARTRATRRSTRTRRVSRIPERRRRTSSPRCRTGSTALGIAFEVIRRWCAASTTTATPLSSSRPIWAPREPCWAAAATTG
jgi:hypothetical protein